MKRNAAFVITCIVVCAVCPRLVNAAPNLNLWMIGSFDSGTSTIYLQVRRTNTEFGLGGLSYDLQFSESLLLTREYSDYGWVAHEVPQPLFDNSNPEDGAAPSSFPSIHFETVCSLVGGEFAPDTGIVESLSIFIPNPSSRSIDFDIALPMASNGSGEDLVGSVGQGGLGGTITLPAGALHHFTINIPEPVTLSLLGLGGLLLIRRRCR